jgi:hypothetical protein
MAGFTIQVLYLFIAMEIGSRRLLHINVTNHPTAEWTRQQFREFLESGGDGAEKVAGDDRFGVVLNECAPSLSRLRGMPTLLYVLADRTGINQNAEFEREFVGKTPLAPARIFLRHCQDKLAQIPGQWRAS